MEASSTVGPTELLGVATRGMPVANIPGLPPASEHDAQQHAPHTGENGPAILSELGYGAAEIDAMPVITRQIGLCFAAEVEGIDMATAKYTSRVSV